MPQAQKPRHDDTAACLLLLALGFAVLGAACLWIVFV